MDPGGRLRSDASMLEMMAVEFAITPADATILVAWLDAHELGFDEPSMDDVRWRCELSADALAGRTLAQLRALGYDLADRARQFFELCAEMVAIDVDAVAIDGLGVVTGWDGQRRRWRLRPTTGEPDLQAVRALVGELKADQMHRPAFNYVAICETLVGGRFFGSLQLERQRGRGGTWTFSWGHGRLRHVPSCAGDQEVVDALVRMRDFATAVRRRLGAGWQVDVEHRFGEEHVVLEVASPADRLNASANVTRLTVVYDVAHLPSLDSFHVVEAVTWEQALQALAAGMARR